jgi:hypothetical protein
MKLNQIRSKAHTLALTVGGMTALLLAATVTAVEAKPLEQIGTTSRGPRSLTTSAAT